MIRSGYWESAEGNCFWIRQKDGQVFWLGMNKSSGTYSLGANWCHVGNGEIKDQMLYLDWSDVPSGKDELSGKIEVEIINETEIKVVKDHTGDFGFSTWTWQNNQTSFAKMLG